MHDGESDAYKPPLHCNTHTTQQQQQQLSPTQRQTNPAAQPALGNDAVSSNTLNSSWEPNGGMPCSYLPSPKKTLPLQTVFFLGGGAIRNALSLIKCATQQKIGAFAFVSGREQTLTLPLIAPWLPQPQSVPVRTEQVVFKSGCRE